MIIVCIAGGFLQANLRQQIHWTRLDEVMNGDDGEEEAYHTL